MAKTFFKQIRERKMTPAMNTLREDRLGVRGLCIEACIEIIKKMHGFQNVILTTSATAALDMVAQFLGPLGDRHGPEEVIIPSWAFPTTAAAFLRAGFTPVLVDVERDTLNIDVGEVEKAITQKTVAIVAVDYAGVTARLQELRILCDKYDLYLIEDAAPAFDAPLLSTLADFTIFSFNDTKNIGCGEGGALCWNSLHPGRSLDMLANKGTNVSAFRRGEVELYGWTAPGFAPLMTELTAAVLLPELQRAADIVHTHQRKWSDYAKGLSGLNKIWKQSTQIGNGHCYWLLAPMPMARANFIASMNRQGIECQRHYQALHNSVMGKTMCRIQAHGYDQNLSISSMAESCLIRLPLHPGVKAIPAICHTIIKTADAAISATTQAA